MNSVISRDASVTITKADGSAVSFPVQNVRYPIYPGYQLKVDRGEDGDTINVRFTYPPRPTVSTRRKRRLARFARLVKAAAYAASAAFVGRPNTRETVDAIRDAILIAMRETAQRYAHLKA
jgi:hypothetical protein